MATGPGSDPRHDLSGAPLPGEGQPVAATRPWAERPARQAPWMLRIRRLPEGPLRWAVLQPNAPRGGEFRGGGSFMARQHTKSLGQYVGERVLLVAGESSVAMWPVMGGCFVGSRVGHWPIDRILAVPVAPNDDRVAADWPAAVLVDLGRGSFITELRGVRDDDHTRAVLAALAC